MTPDNALIISASLTLIVLSGCLNLVLWYLLRGADASADYWRGRYTMLRARYAAEYEKHSARDPKTGRFTSRKRKEA